MPEKNIFGGGNARSLYVPMSEIEQEVLARLAEAGDFRVTVVDWGVVNQPRITFGDARLQVAFRLNFDRPPPPGIPVVGFDLELRTGSGLLLFKKWEVINGGRPVMVAAGVFFDFVWDIAIQHIDPRVVKALMPGAGSLTSRLQDKDTGEMTLTGNMKLNSEQQKLLRTLRRGEAKVRSGDAKKK